MWLRTIKIVIASCTAIFLAQWLNLSYANSAGIIAILSVLDTRKTSLLIGFQRLMSTILALFVGIVVFQILGFSTWGFGAYLAIYVPIAYYFNIHVGIAPSSVLVMHLFLEKNISFEWIINEWLLMAIGAGTAIILNIYVPSKQKSIDQYRIIVEEELQKILMKFHFFLLSGDGKNDAILIKQLKQTIEEAKSDVLHEQDNQLFSTIHYELHYFEMRMEQVKLLEIMAKNINDTSLEVKEAKVLAGLFYLAANQISEYNSGKYIMEDIETLLEYFRQGNLPKTREEFEKRAILFQLLTDFIRFIELKIDFYDEYCETIHSNAFLGLKKS